MITPNQVIKSNDSVEITFVSSLHEVTDIQKYMATQYGKYTNLREMVINIGRYKLSKIDNVIFLKTMRKDTGEIYDVLFICSPEGSCFTTSESCITSMKEIVEMCDVTSLPIAFYGRKSTKRANTIFLDCVVDI